MSEILNNMVDLINKNSGVVQISLFFLSLIIAWVAGLFKYLQRKPKFIIKLLEGPTQYSEIETGEMKRACFSLYLKIANIGQSSSSIKSIKIIYKTDTPRFSILNFFDKWSSNIHLTINLSNFEHSLNNEDKIPKKQYPFLIQHNEIIDNPDKFLERGKSTQGVIYFESEKYNEKDKPKIKEGLCVVKIYIKDVFSNKHVFKVKVPYKTIEEAKKYNSDFGNSYESIEKK